MINFVTVIDNGLFIKSMPLLMNVRLQPKDYFWYVFPIQSYSSKYAKISKNQKYDPARKSAALFRNLLEQGHYYFGPNWNGQSQFLFIDPFYKTV